MKLLLAFLFTVATYAQTGPGASLSWYIDGSGGSTPTGQLQTLPTSYTFANTPVGSVTSLVVRVVNNGSSEVTLNVIYVGASAGSPSGTPNFSVTGAQANAKISTTNPMLFTVNFTPSVIGPSVGYLQANDGTSSFAVAMLVGSGTPPQLTLSCAATTVAQCTGSTLQPNSGSALDFGAVSTASSISIPFTLANNSGTAVNPQSLVSVATAANNPNTAFSLTGLPATLLPGTSATFNLVFAPGAANVYQTNLLVGSAQYLIRGTGQSSVVGDLTSLVITYTDSLGVRLTAQPATAISFGSQVANSSNAPARFTFAVSNPSTTIQPVSVPAIAVSGTGFVLSGLPTLPASIAPGASINFVLSFQPSTTGSFTGSLAIGSRQFALSGQGTQSSVATPTFAVDVSPLVSARQAHLSISLSAASPIANAGTLTLSFTPSTTLAKDDPAIVFLATGGRELNVVVAQGSQTLTYDGESSFGFQTGTTAGTLKFTLAFPNSQTYTQSYTLAPATIQISSATAKAQDPNLVVTMTGYDNTATAGPMTFTFYDAGGNVLLAKPVAVDATVDFKNFFTSAGNQTGGAFSIQLTFPITGDITKIANMGIVLTNSAGSTSVKQ